MCGAKNRLVHSNRFEQKERLSQSKKIALSNSGFGSFGLHLKCIWLHHTKWKLDPVSFQTFLKLVSSVKTEIFSAFLKDSASSYKGNVFSGWDVTQNLRMVWVYKRHHSAQFRGAHMEKQLGWWDFDRLSVKEHGDEHNWEALPSLWWHLRDVQLFRRASPTTHYAPSPAEHSLYPGTPAP